jgi:hypothetical protein
MIRVSGGTSCGQTLQVIPLSSRLVRLAVTLKGFVCSNYTKKEQVLEDLITVVKETKKVIDSCFAKYEVKEVSQNIDELLKELEEGK